MRLHTLHIIIKYRFYQNIKIILLNQLLHMTNRSIFLNFAKWSNGTNYQSDKF